ncbi:hypothetical protein BDN72DRAFT_838809 [Pluteus cervinus]|uniref:Uncharacterized protein n=1 Tax=Pluteus cervinus TaxID=181527 RepID=A0ACD3AY07_9AGAR|nr:hypothetical protein BDN72DRAFT_838809 [Pluteus cervinus]
MEAATNRGTRPSNPESPADSLFHELPPEILFHIFQLTITPGCFLDHSLSRGPNSEWCEDLRIRKTLLLVCKFWHLTALPILYRYVIIRRVGQLVALSRTLEDNPKRIGTVVQSIVLEGFVPQGYSKLFTQRIEVILGICPALSSLSFNVLLPKPTSTLDISVNKNITHLTLSGNTNYGDVSQILQNLCDCLTYLSIRVSSGDPDLSISFPRLKTIISNFDTQAITHTTFNWTMPVLTAITVHILGGENPQCLTACASFCGLHGRNVKSLCLSSGYGPAQRIPMQSVINYCPSIEYLQASSGMIKWLSHPRVKHIDIGDSPFPHGPQNNPTVPDLLSYDWDCPSLSRVRFFTGDLFLIEGLKNSLPLDFERSPENPSAGISFENLCVCRTALHGRDVQYIHPLGDHRPTDLGKGIDVPDPTEKEWDDSDRETDSFGSASDDSWSATSTSPSGDEDLSPESSQFGEFSGQMPGPPDVHQALELFTNSLEVGSGPMEGDDQHWWSYVDSEVNAWDDEESS